MTPPAPRRLGWQKDPPKLPHERPDLRAADLLVGLPIPPSASNRDQIVDILDQGPLGSCVANAISQAVRAAHVREGITDPKLPSRLFGYWVSRAYHHATDIDDGTFLRTYFQGLAKFGFCPESAWQYDPSRFADMPPAAAFRFSYDQTRPTIYSRIDSAGAERVDDIKRAIAAGHCVCFGTLVSEAFCRDENIAAVVQDPPVGQPIAGGHALCLVGYNGDVFDIVNSWSTGWGLGGWCHFSAEYLAWSETNDIWIVNQVPAYSESAA